MNEKTKVCLLALFLASLLIHIAAAEITAPVDIIVIKGKATVDNATVQVDGKYMGETSSGGHLRILNLTLGFHTVYAEFVDYSGKYAGDSGFEIKPGNTVAKVYLEGPKK